MEITSSLLNASEMSEVKKSLIEKSNDDGYQDFRVKMLEYINDTAEADGDDFFFDMLEFVRFLDATDKAIAYTDEYSLIWLNAPGQVGEELRPWDFIYDHECLHQLWDTFGVRDKIISNGDPYIHDLLNIASDCVINDYLAVIRKKHGPKNIGIITPEYLESTFNVIYDRKIDTQYTLYMKLIEHKDELLKDKTINDALNQGKIKPKSIEKQNGPTPPPPPPSGPHSDAFKKGWSDAIDDVLDGKVNPTDPKYTPKATGNKDYDSGYNAAMDNIREGVNNGIKMSDDDSGAENGNSDLRNIPWDIPQQKQQQNGSGSSSKSDNDSDDNNSSESNGDKSDKSGDNKSGDGESGDGESGNSSSNVDNQTDSEIAQSAADHAKKAADAAKKAADAAERAASSSKSSDAKSAASKARKAADKAQAAADKAQAAADKAKQAAAKGNKEGEQKAKQDAHKAANEASEYARDAANEAAKTGDKDAIDAAKNAAEAGKPFSKGNVEQNAGSKGASHNGSSTDDFVEYDANLEEIRKRAQDVIQRYRDKLTGPLNDFLQKCRSSVKCEKDGLMVNSNRGVASWNQQLNTNIRGFIKKKVAKMKRLKEDSYKRPNRRQGILKPGDYILPGKRTKKNGIPLKVAFYIDRSGSMGNSVYNAFDACYAICESVKKQFKKEKLIDEIAFDVYTFNERLQHITFGKKVGTQGGTCSLPELLEFVLNNSKDFLINVIITDAEFYDISSLTTKNKIKKFIEEISGALNFVINNSGESARTMQKHAKENPTKIFYIQADSDFTVK